MSDQRLFDSTQSGDFKAVQEILSTETVDINFKSIWIFYIYVEIQKHILFILFEFTIIYGIKTDFFIGPL